MQRSGTLCFGPQRIEELKVGEKVNWYYKILEFSKKKKKDGSDYLTLQVMDRSGKMPVKVWENADQYERILRIGGVFRFEGDVTEYNQKKELRASRISPLTGKEDDFSPADFEESAPFDTDACIVEMKALVAVNIMNPYLKELVEKYFQKFEATLKLHYGAQKIHHAYPGGLLEHTFYLLKLAVFIADLYRLDRELLIVGVLFHDIGKLDEFLVDPAPEITREGGLLGHVVISYSRFLELMQQVPGFPEFLAVKVGHMIVSHHGEKEFGAPEVPKTPEAYALHVIDLLDSRMNIFREAVQSVNGKTPFSDFIHSLGTRVFVEKE